MERVKDILNKKPDEPVSIVGNIIPPFNATVDNAAAMERIFGDQGPIKLGLESVERKDSAGTEHSSNNSSQSASPLSDYFFSTER